MFRDDVTNVFETCNRFTDADLINDYMYMYSIGHSHWFKNIETRKYIEVVARLNQFLNNMK